MLDLVDMSLNAERTIKRDYTFFNFPTPPSFLFHATPSLLSLSLSLSIPQISQSHSLPMFIILSLSASRRDSEKYYYHLFLFSLPSLIFTTRFTRARESSPKGSPELALSFRITSRACGFCYVCYRSFAFFSWYPS